MSDLHPVKGPFCRFYIVRHGETTANAAGVIQGHMNADLTDKGIEQAMRRAIDFKVVQFADVFSSDLLRAQRTASILSKEHQLIVKTSAQIKERFYGKYEGYTYQDYEKEIAHLLQEYEAMLEDERRKHRFAGELESEEEIFQRFLRFFRDAAVAYPGKNVLVVTHGTIFRHFLIRIGYGTSQTLPSKSIQNLGYAVIDCDGVEFFVRHTVGIHKQAQQ